MAPKYWPKGFVYSRESVTSEYHPLFLRHFLSSLAKADPQRISHVIEEKRVHPDIEIKILTKQLPKKHSLANRKSQRGHVHRGVFATQLIPAGTELGEYVGEVTIMSIEEFLQVGEQKHALSEYAWRVILKDYLVFVEAKRFANELAFVNEYRGLENQPNVTIHWIPHRGSFYLGYSTRCDIQPGEELLADYTQNFRTGKNLS